MVEMTAAASLGLFDDGMADPGIVGTYRPLHLDLHTAAEARDRILQRMATASNGATLDQLLPTPDEPEDEERRTLRWRSVWVSTFSVSLKLAQLGKVVVKQGQAFTPIHITRPQAVDVELPSRLHLCFKLATTDVTAG
jgi:hypothetical protein